MSENRKSDQIHDAVKQHYGNAITRSQTSTGCCGSSGPIQLDGKAPGQYASLAGYTAKDLANAPESATTFGCGNPVAFSGVKEGETVLDLGSGAGLDLILASHKVGSSGKVIGLDMTPEMIETCRSNLEKAGVTNAEVRQGMIEEMPVADSEVDWIISNCVINLSPDKQKVFSEAFRVLKPGGHVMVSDIVTYNLPEEYRDDITAWVGCLAGAVEESEYLEIMREVGFTDVEIVDRLVYDRSGLGTLAGDACSCGGDSSDGSVSDDLIDKYAGRVASVKVSAVKPS